MEILKKISGIGNAIQSKASSILNKVQNSYNQNLNNIRSQTTKAQTLFDNVQTNVNNSFQQNLNIPKPTFKSIDLEPKKIVSSLVNHTLDTKVPLQQFGIPAFKEYKLRDYARGIRDITVKPVARIGFEGTQTLMGDNKVYKLKSPLARALLGNEPLRNWNDKNRPAYSTLRGVGLKENQVDSIAPFLVLAGVGVDLVPVTMGKGKVAKEGGEIVAKNVVKHQTKEGAQKLLKELLTYENELRKAGFSEKETAKISVNRARELLPQYDQASVQRSLNQARYYAEEKKEVFNKAFKSWIGFREEAKTIGTEVGYKYRNVPSDLAWDVVRYLDDNSVKVSPKVKEIAKQFKAEFDALHDEAIKAGIDQNYLDEYITHIWKENPEQVQRILGASPKFKYSKSRTIPTYEAGISAGLTPKYFTPQEILAHYKLSLYQAKANIKLLETLKKEGIIVDSAVGKGNSDFLEITGAGFPRSISKDYAGNTVIGSYFAPRELANILNRVTSEPSGNLVSKGLRATSSISKTAQDFVLSSGLPNTPINSFAIFALMQRELASLRAKTPIQAFLRSFDRGASEKYFENNIETIKKMQRNNIRLETEFSLDNITHNNRTFFEKLLPYLGLKKNAITTAFGNPTFHRLLPMLQIDLFKQTEAKMLAQGKNADDAERIATEAIRNFYGALDTASMAKRPEDVTNAMNTLLLAPYYRETLLKFFLSTGKGITKVNSPEYEANRRFLLGTAIAFVAWDSMNYYLNGNHIWENPPSTRLYLQIPVGKITGNPDDYASIPFMPLLSTLPRFVARTAMNIPEGNTKQILSDSRFLASIPLQTGITLATNEDYFGRPVYDSEKGLTHPDNREAIAFYLAKSHLHPYAQFGVDKLAQQSDDPTIQKLYGNRSDLELAMRAVELPVRFHDINKLNASWYYEIRDKELKNLTPEEQAIYEELQKKNSGAISTINEARIRLENPQIVEVERRIALEIAKKTKQPVSPFAQLPPEYQKVILTYKSMPPSPERSEVINQNMNWLPEYWKAEGAYYDQLNLKKTELTEEDKVAKANDIEPFKTTPEIQSLLDQYYSFPKGTGQRSSFVRQHPELETYWQEKRAHDNKVRSALGLPPLTNTFSSFGYSKKSKFNRYAGLRSKKISVKKSKKLKEIALKPKKVKLTLPTLKIRMPKKNRSLQKYYA